MAACLLLANVDHSVAQSRKHKAEVEVQSEAVKEVVAEAVTEVAQPADTTAVKISADTLNVVKNESFKLEEMPQNEIWYKSTNGVGIFLRDRFGDANIVSHTYENGKGVIKFDKDVIEIEPYAFYRYNTLARIVIPNGVTSIGAEAFRYCHNLKEVTFGKGIAEIKKFAFEGCISLTEANLSDGLTAIERSAFDGCTSLANVVLPKSVTTLGERAFAACGITTLTIPAGVSALPSGLCCGCTALKYVEIPSSVTSIGYQTLYGASGELVIDSEIIGVDNTQGPAHNPNSWLSGTKFTKVTIGNNVTKIGAYTFADYSTLEDIAISESVTSIGSNALANVRITTKLIIPKGVVSIGHKAFAGCSGELVIDGKIIESDCSLYNAPTDVNIGWLSGAKFESVIIGENVSRIGAYTFANWATLRKVELSNSVKVVGYHAFAGSGLTKLLITKSVSLIEYNAFDGCSDLATILLESETPPQLGENAFAGCPGSCRIYVPESSVKLYKESWKSVFGKHAHIEKATSIY